MARQAQPELVGQLKSNEVGILGWEVLVWRLPNGGTRLTAQKAVVDEKQANPATKLEQLPLVDIHGNKV
jgi:hypothetical protein